MSLGDLVKELRMQRGLSQPELASLSSLSVGFISKIEKGYYQFTSRESIAKIARALKVKPDVLYGAFSSQDTIVKDSPPRSFTDAFLEFKNVMPIAVPVVADMHAPGRIMEYLYIPKPQTGHKNFYGVKIRDDCLSPKAEDGDKV
jgi:transcriptional regulator with XRE-family HTH domain